MDTDPTQMALLRAPRVVTGEQNAVSGLALLQSRITTETDAGAFISLLKPLWNLFRQLSFKIWSFHSFLGRLVCNFLGNLFSAFLHFPRCVFLPLNLELTIFALYLHSFGGL